MKTITVVYLFDNDLSSLPDSIGKLSNLKEISLANNQLKNLPESIANLTSLTQLDVIDNPFEDLPIESIKKLIAQGSKIYGLS